MIGYLLTLSVLIAVVLLIRALFRRTVSPRVIYALWLVVVIRMLVPITLFEIDVTVPEFLRAEQNEQVSGDSQSSENTQFFPQTVPSVPSQESQQITPNDQPVITPPTPVTPIIPDETQATEIITPEINPSDIIAPETSFIEVTTPEDPATDVTKARVSVNWKQIADLVWFSGALITAVWFSLTSFTYTRNLHKDRKLHKTVNGTKVYISESADVPCIAGIIPSIYITPEAADSKSEALIIAHEYTHLRHGDHIWSFIRVLAIVIFWYNPLVWIAAFVSKQDAELACDDAVSSKMSDDGRLEYANILINTIPQSHRYAVGLGSAPIKKRILMLTKKQKNRLVCLILAAALTITAVGCSFASLNEKETEQPPVDSEPIDTDPIDTDPVDTEHIDTDAVDTEQVDTGGIPEEFYTFVYDGVKYDLSELYPAVNAVWEWGHIGKYVIAEGHINPNMSAFAVIDPETQKIEHHFAGCIPTCHSDDVNSIVYSYWNTVKAYDGTVLAQLELSDGEYIRSIEYTEDNTKIVVTIDAEDSPRTVTIDLSPSEDTGTDPVGNEPEDVIAFTSPNGRYSVKFYIDTAASYPVSSLYYLPCNRVSLIDNQTGNELASESGSYTFPSLESTARWSSDSKYFAIIVGDSRYASSPLLFDTVHSKISNTYNVNDNVNIVQVLENDSGRPVKSVLYSIHERVVEFSGDTARICANIKVGSAEDDKYVIAEYVYDFSSGQISELTYTFSDNYYPTAEGIVTASLDKIMEGYGKYDTPKEYVNAYPSEYFAIVNCSINVLPYLDAEVIKLNSTATSDIERTRALIARYISEKISPGLYSTESEVTGGKYKIIARATQIISSADESPDYTDISLCYADSDEPLLTLNGPFYDGRFYWSKDGKYVIIAAGKDSREASLIIGQSRRYIVLPKDEIFTQAAEAFGKNAKLLDIGTDYGVWKSDSLVEIKYDMTVRDSGKTYRVYGTYTYNVPKCKIEQITFNGLPNGVTHATFNTAQSGTTAKPTTSDNVKNIVNENLDILVSVNLGDNGQLKNSSFRQDDYINANKAAFDEIVALGESAFAYLNEIGNKAFEYNITPAAQARCILARVAIHKIRPSFFDCVLPVPDKYNQSTTSQYSLAFTAIDLFDLAAPEGERSIGYKVSLLKNGKVVCIADKELGYLSNPSAAGNIIHRWSDRYLLIASCHSGMYAQVDFFDLEKGKFIDIPDIPEISAMFTSSPKKIGTDGKLYDKIAMEYTTAGSNVFTANLMLKESNYSGHYSAGYFSYDLDKRELLCFYSSIDGKYIGGILLANGLVVSTDGLYTDIPKHTRTVHTNTFSKAI